MNMSNTTKSRYWWFIAYPESLPNNWEEILLETMLPIYISPLHLYDIDSNGNTKKPHYHIIVTFDGPTTFRNVHKNICVPLNATIPKLILSVKGAYDYLTHKNNPDKYQYHKEDIIYLNGANESLVDKEQFINDGFYFIENFIVDNSISNFRTLVLSINALGNSHLSSLLRTNAYYFKLFLS